VGWKSTLHASPPHHTPQKNGVLCMLPAHLHFPQVEVAVHQLVRIIFLRPAVPVSAQTAPHDSGSVPPQQQQLPTHGGLSPARRQRPIKQPAHAMTRTAPSQTPPTHIYLPPHTNTRTHTQTHRCMSMRVATPAEPWMCASSAPRSSCAASHRPAGGEWEGFASGIPARSPEEVSLRVWLNPL
jgi:hypothetical protein